MFGGMVGVLVALIVWSLIPLFICASLAGKKGKSKGLWVLLGIVFGWIAVLVLAVSASEN